MSTFMLKSLRKQIKHLVKANERGPYAVNAY